MTTFHWFGVFLIVGVVGLVFVIVKTRSAFGEVSYLIKNRRMREAVECYCAWEFILSIYLIIFCVISTWFVLAPH